jgi:hypothetical protein
MKGQSTRAASGRPGRPAVPRADPEGQLAGSTVLRAGQSNRRPSAGLQNDYRSTGAEFACKQAPSRQRRQFEGGADCPFIVRRRRRTIRLPTRKRPAKCRPSAKRLKGFEPSTFCMASRRSSQLSYSRRPAEYSRGPGPGYASASPSTSSSNQARLPPAPVSSRPHPSASRSTSRRP